VKSLVSQLAELRALLAANPDRAAGSIAELRASILEARIEQERADEIREGQRIYGAEIRRCWRLGWFAPYPWMMQSPFEAQSFQMRGRIAFRLILPDPV
jgi:hypothetical protein